MTPFVLDERLARDSLPLGESNLSLLRLVDNALVPWLILVPKVDCRELYELGPDDQTRLLAQIHALSRFLTAEFAPDKLNVAAIGNLVPQLHIHLVARRRDDFCWPGVVWGRPERQPYTPAEVERLRALVAARLSPSFTAYCPDV